jgi:hypothetical protein
MVDDDNVILVASWLLIARNNNRRLTIIETYSELFRHQSQIDCCIMPVGPSLRIAEDQPGGNIVVGLQARQT